MSELIDALDNNFDGYEALHGALLAAPKFGNDIDYVDSIVNDILEFASSVLDRYEGIAETKHTLAAMAGTGIFVMGSKVGALPDGRLAGKPLAEGGISPSQGKNTSGATASMRSVAKLNHTAISGGSVLTCGLILAPSTRGKNAQICAHAQNLLRDRRFPRPV